MWGKNNVNDSYNFVCYFFVAFDEGKHSSAKRLGLQTEGTG